MSSLPTTGTSNAPKRFAAAIAICAGALGACDVLFDLESLDSASNDDAGLADGGAIPGTPTPLSGMHRVLIERMPNVTLRGVWVESADHVTIVGDDGVLLQSNGPDWVMVENGIGVDLYGVWTSAEGGFAVGELRDSHRGLILERHGSTDWKQRTTTEYPLRSVWGTVGHRYACGVDGACYDGPTYDPFRTGTRFLPLDGGPPTAPTLWSIGGLSATDVLVAADLAGFESFNGSAWLAGRDKVDPTRAYRAVFGVAGTGVILLGGNHDGLWRREPKAQPTDPTRLSLLHEDRRAEGQNRIIHGVWGVGDSAIGVGTDGHVVLWDPVAGPRVVDAPGGRTLYGIGGTSLDDVWMVGEAGVVLHGSVRF